MRHPRTLRRHWAERKVGLILLGFLVVTGALWVGFDSFVSWGLPGWGHIGQGLVALLATLCVLGTLGFVWGRAARRRHPDVFGPFNDAFLKIARGDYSVQVSVSHPNPGADNPFQTMAANLNAMAGSLAKVEELRRQFVADVSHEFQSPLTSILGFAQALKGDTLPPGLRERYLGIVETEARRLSRLAETLLKLNALEDRVGPPDPEPFRLDVQLRRVLVALEPLWSAKLLEVEADLVEIEVNGNEGLWTQVWTNLIHNAVKFTPQGGQIAVRATLNPSLQVEIQDSGIGLAADQVTRVFERFYKAESSRSNADGQAGNGLGLALVRRIVELHGARVEAISPGLGRGTVVRVSFPPPLP